MFFGQEVKTSQNKASTMTMETGIKLSQAVLDPSTKGNKKEPVCLMAEIQGKSFMLAVLDPNQSWQCPLDLMLAAGTEVKFYLKGQGVIHLTGYEFPDDDDDFELSMSSDDEMDEESPDEVEAKQPAKKQKVKNSPVTNGVKPKALKMKESGDASNMQDSDDDDSDDEDLSFGSDDGDDEEIDSSDMDDVDLDGVSDEEDEDDDEDDSD
jgi:hypothetical protein